MRVSVRFGSRRWTLLDPEGSKEPITALGIFVKKGAVATNFAAAVRLVQQQTVPLYLNLTIHSDAGCDDELRDLLAELHGKVRDVALYTAVYKESILNFMENNTFDRVSVCVMNTELWDSFNGSISKWQTGRLIIDTLPETNRQVTDVFGAVCKMADTPRVQIGYPERPTWRAVKKARKYTQLELVRKENPILWHVVVLVWSVVLAVFLLALIVWVGVRIAPMLFPHHT